MQTTQTQPDADMEITFGFDELFFSRTDRAGIIRYGNEVFTRISGFSWDELVEKPHKIVRHPDMPRAVFWLLWDTIKQDRPIGAFVKNRTKDGRYYWVFAIVTPIEGGYLSVRLRPSSEMLSTVAREYSALAAAERTYNLAPGKSAELLLARLGELGFANYQAFMAVALGGELAARQTRLGIAADPMITHFERLVANAHSLISHAQAVTEAYIANENVPFNFRVLAAQLGQDGAAIGVISSNYSLLSEEMRTIIADFIAAAGRVRSAIDDGYFLAATARTQCEMVELFRAELAENGEVSSEMDLLDSQQSEYRNRAARGLNEISRAAAGFRTACIDMNRLAAGLEVTRVMGKVECARHTSVKDRLDKLLGDLETFQRLIVQALKDIGARNNDILDATNNLLASTNRAA